MELNKNIRKSVLAQIESLILSLTKRMQLTGNQIIPLDQYPLDGIDDQGDVLTQLEFVNHSNQKASDIIENSNVLIQKLMLLRDHTQEVPTDMLLYLFNNFDRFSTEEMIQIVEVARHSDQQ